MRVLAMVLVLIGLVGVVFGVLHMIHGAQAAGGIPFRFENYGGPGSILGGLILMFGGLYLSSLRPRRG